MYLNQKKWGTLLYAGNSGSILALNKSLADNIQKFTRGDFSTLNEDTLILLEKHGVIIDTTDDELLDIMMTKLKMGVILLSSFYIYFLIVYLKSKVSPCNIFFHSHRSLHLNFLLPKFLRLQVH